MTKDSIQPVLGALTPGSMRKITAAEEAAVFEAARKRPEIAITPWETKERVEAFGVFASRLSPKLDVIYYPGSEADESPSKTDAFKNSRIIYLDSSEKAMKAMQEKGYEAHSGDAETFDPGSVDLLLQLNFFKEKTLEYVKSGGYVICNKHWGGGILPDMLARDDFEILGVLTNNDEKGMVFEKKEAKGFSFQKEEGQEMTESAPRAHDDLFVFRKK